MFSKRRLPAYLEEAGRELGAVVDILDEAAEALTACVPTSRLPGRPLAECLFEFEGLLRRALARMPGWRRPEVEGEWTRADSAVREALSRSESLRTQGPDPVGLEALIGALQDLMLPLEALRDAEVRFRDLRMRG